MRGPVGGWPVWWNSGLPDANPLTSLGVTGLGEDQKKGRTRVRPKSREETPKEGMQQRDVVALSQCNI